MEFSAEIYTQRAIARLAKAEKKIIKQGFATTKDIVNLGKEYARIKAPKNTGNVYQSIKGRTITTSEGSQGEVYVDMEQVESGTERRFGQGRYGANFNLVRWMHKTGGKFQSDNPYGKAGKQHIPKDNAQFMYRTRSYLKNVGVDVARKNFNIRF